MCTCVLNAQQNSDGLLLVVLHILLPEKGKWWKQQSGSAGLDHLVGGCGGRKEETARFRGDAFTTQNWFQVK